MSLLTQTPNFFWVIIGIILLFVTQQVLSASPGPRADKLIINEFMAANRTGLTDGDGDTSDWIELYNPGSRAVNLGGWYLTDDPQQPEKWPLPNIRLDSNQYLLVFASGKNRSAAEPETELHTSFRLGQNGEFLGIYNVFENRFTDIAAPEQAEVATGQKFPAQFPDIAYGRLVTSSTNFGYLSSPTPGQPNNTTLRWTGLVAPVELSRERGFYQTPFTLELSVTTPDATIRYTTDGSEPTETHGTIYGGAIPISTTTLLRVAAFKSNFHPAPVETYTYIFLNDVLTQSNNPPGFPKSWGVHQGVPVTADYELDPEITNHPHYAKSLKEALTSIPTLSIVTDKQSFYELYTNPRRRGRAWERPISVEWIDPHTGNGFQANAGARIQGELGRAEYMPKHNFRLFFRSEYGPAWLHYKLFADSPVEQFDTLVLRAGVNRSFAGYPKREEEIRLTTYTRDEWLRASQIAMSGSSARGRFVHLYLNGLYWGLYNVVERPDEAFMATYFGGVKEDWQAISHEETVSTTSERFKTLHQLAAEGGLEDPEKYALITSYLDVPHFIDYLILNWYAGNLDWGFNNWYAGVPRTSGPVKYFVWDGERTWFNGAEIYMELDEYLERPNLVKPLFEALLENPDFRMALADRMYKHLFNGGPLTDANARARWLRLNNLIESAIIAESARWGDARFEPPLTQADWFKARDDVLAQMEGNATKLISLAREAGYYPDLDPPHFNLPDGSVKPGFKLTMTASNGLIYYTTDGSDPRLQVTGAVAPQARIYRSPLILTTTTHIKARALAGDTWSALNEMHVRSEE